MSDVETSYIYAIIDIEYSENNPTPQIKIGKSDNPETRRKQGLTWCPGGLKILFAKKVENPFSIEKEIHETLKDYHKSGEWFIVDIEIVKRLFTEIDGVWWEEIKIKNIKNTKDPYIPTYKNFFNDHIKGLVNGTDGHKRIYTQPATCKRITELMGDNIETFISALKNQNCLNKKLIIRIINDSLEKEKLLNYPFPKAYLNNTKKYFESI